MAVNSNLYVSGLGCLNHETITVMLVGGSYRIVNKRQVVTPW